MKNINKFSLIFALLIMVFAFSALAPSASARFVYENVGGMKNVTYVNERPVISSINPNPIEAGSGGDKIAIIGYNFAEGAVAKVNNRDRSTYFISGDRIAVELLDSDVSRVGDKVITVYNPGPGGGLSNGIVLSIVSPSAPAPITTVSSGSVSSGASNSAKSTTVKKPVVETKPEGEVLGDEDVSDLASGALFGSGNFFPGSLVGWLILAILILLLVIIIRKMFGAEKRYHETPLKHA